MRWKAGCCSPVASAALVQPNDDLAWRAPVNPASV